MRSQKVNKGGAGPLSGSSPQLRSARIMEQSARRPSPFNARVAGEAEDDGERLGSLHATEDADEVCVVGGFDRAAGRARSAIAAGPIGGDVGPALRARVELVQRGACRDLGEPPPIV